MKNTIALILLISASFGSQAQCDILKKEVDDFSGRQEILIKSKSLFKIGWKTTFYLSATDSVYLFSIKIGSMDIFTVREGQLLQIKYGDEIMELPCVSTVIASANSEIGWSAFIGYLVTEEQLQILSSATLSKMRVNMTEGDKDYEFRKKDSASLNETVSCFLKEVHE